MATLPLPDPTQALLNGPRLLPTPALAGAAPSLGAPSMPNVSLTPSAPMSRLAQDQNSLLVHQRSGSGVDQITHPVDEQGNPTGGHQGIGWKLLGGLARVGDGALTFLSPGAAMVVPGTTLHHGLQLRSDRSRIGEDLGEAQQQATIHNLDLQPQFKQMAAENAFLKTGGYLQHVSDTGQHYEDMGQHYTDQTDAGLAEHGYKRDPATGATVPMQYGEMSPQLQAIEDLKHAQTEQANAQADLKKAQNDPTSPNFRLAQQRADIAQQNANTALKRISLYGQSLDLRRQNTQANLYGTDLNNNPLPGAPQIGDGNGGTITAGLRVGPQAAKNNANAAKFNDVHGALTSVEQAAQQLVQSGGALNSPRVVAALTQSEGPKGWISGSMANYLKSQNASALSPAERGYVQALAAAHENIQALRGAVGSGVSDSQINRLDSMIPGAQTPDLNYLMGQTGQIRSTADRLGQGVTTAAGGIKVHGHGNPGQQTPGTVKMQAPDGSTQDVPASQVQHFTKLGAKVVQ